MKKILLAATVTGFVAALLIMYLQRSEDEKVLDDVEGAAEDAYDAMNKHINKLEQTSNKVLKDITDEN